MKRLLIALLLAGLVLVPAASAKGPHAILTTPPEVIQAGEPWEFTIELNEFRDPPVPAMIGTRGGRTVGAHVRTVPASMSGAAGFRFTMVFPSEGRWKLRMFAGKRRFSFASVDVGGATAPPDYVAFPLGSEAAKQGAGGVYITDEAPVAPAGGQTAISERSQTRGSDPSREDGGMGAWALPLLGVVLAGAGVAAVSRRGAR
jgi:hypothetical protein